MNAHATPSSLLVLGEAVKAGALAIGLRGADFLVTVATTLSEVRDLVAGGYCPTALVVDARTSVPWRVDALVRMVELVCVGPTATLWLGEPPAADVVPEGSLVVVPPDAALPAIVKALRALQDGAAPHELPPSASRAGRLDA